MNIIKENIILTKNALFYKKNQDMEANSIIKELIEIATSNKNEKDFKQGIKYAYHATKYEGKNDVVTTLFCTKKNISRKEKVKNIYRLSKMIEKEPNMPKNITVTTQLGDNKITPKKPRYDDTNPIEFGAFNDE